MRLDIMVRFLVGGGAVLVSAASTLAQTVTVEKSEIGCDANRWTILADNIASGTPINITDIDNTWTAIRVRSTSGTNPASIGRITLTTGEPRNAPFEVLITTEFCLPEFPATDLTPTGTSWSGLTFGENSDSLRNNTRLVAAISGDLTALSPAAASIAFSSAATSSPPSRSTAKTASPARAFPTSSRENF